MEIGKRIKNLRTKRGMSQQELGDALGVTKVSVCGYENGTRTPSLETFILIADIFGTSTDYVLGLTENENENSNYDGDFVKEDIDIIEELRKHPLIYNKMLKDVKRYMNLIYKKMK